MRSKTDGSRQSSYSGRQHYKILLLLWFTDFYRENREIADKRLHTYTGSGWRRPCESLVKASLIGVRRPQLVPRIPRCHRNANHCLIGHTSRSSRERQASFLRSRSAHRPHFPSITICRRIARACTPAAKIPNKLTLLCSIFFLVISSYQSWMWEKMPVWNLVRFPPSFHSLFHYSSIVPFHCPSLSLPSLFCLAYLSPGSSLQIQLGSLGSAVSSPVGLTHSFWFILSWKSRSPS